MGRVRAPTRLTVRSQSRSRRGAWEDANEGRRARSAHRARTRLAFAIAFVPGHARGISKRSFPASGIRRGSAGLASRSTRSRKEHEKRSSQGHAPLPPARSAHHRHRWKKPALLFFFDIAIAAASRSGGDKAIALPPPSLSSRAVVARLLPYHRPLPSPPCCSLIVDCCF